VIGNTGRVHWTRRTVATALAGFVMLGGAAFGAVEQIERATVDAPARRDVPFDPAADCDLATVQSIAGRHPGVRQLIVVATSSSPATTGTLEVAVRSSSGEWRCQRAGQAARVGRNGTRPLLERRSGDGTTPAGVFPLGTVTAWDGQELSMFGNLPDPGVLVPYRHVQHEDCWGATPNTSRYQHLVNRPNCTGPDEWLARFGEVYGHAAVIGANLDPISGDAPGEIPYAAAIFLHRHSYSTGSATKPTSGCVSLAYDDLVGTLRLIDPRLDPHFAIGPVEYLRTAA
jgi:L,D-peptidoglycan transpeptidase YkuD (ErfK/YbiS/YcfS/YnhG family)